MRRFHHNMARLRLANTKSPKMSQATSFNGVALVKLKSPNSIAKGPEPDDSVSISIRVYHKGRWLHTLQWVDTCAQCAKVSAQGADPANNYSIELISFPERRLR